MSIRERPKRVIDGDIVPVAIACPIYCLVEWVF